jgi:hypothetical protein
MPFANLDQSIFNIHHTSNFHQQVEYKKTSLEGHLNKFTRNFTRFWVKLGQYISKQEINEFIMPLVNIDYLLQT